jgi:DNA-binding NarL/FixJ family response regulator
MANITPVKIAIVDDHQIVIDGILSLLENNPLFKVVLSATSSRQMLTFLEDTAVDVLITDVMMPEMSGQELARAVKSRFPSIKIFALSMSGQGEVIDDMINQSDISGYVLKNIGKEELAEAILKIAAGGIYFSSSIVDELYNYSNAKTRNQEIHITSREIDIIRLIEKEYPNKLIAETLFISERTVETHRKNIMRKTETNNVIGIIKYAYRHKLI